MITRPFLSNGTMGDMWRAVWCNGCRHDHNYHVETGSDEGCNIMLRLVVGDFPIEEITDPDSNTPWDPTRTTCSSYKPCNLCHGWPDELEGQLDLFGVAAVRDQTKTVTRRHVDTWQTLKAGDQLTLIEKGMGLAKGEKQVILAEVEIVGVYVQHLINLTYEDVAREGFGPESHLGGSRGWRVWGFADFWARSHGYSEPASRNAWVEIPCRRIEWRYLS